VLGAHLRAATLGSQPPRRAHSGIGLTITDTVTQSLGRGFEQASAGLADPLPGHPEPVQCVRRHPDLQQAQQQVLRPRHAALGLRHRLGGVQTRHQAGHQRQAAPSPPFTSPSRAEKRCRAELELFDTDPLVGAGLPFWLPAGAAVRHALEEYIRELGL
jgi:hypothetical protein